MFLTVAGLVGVVTVPLYLRPRANRIEPESAYAVEEEFDKDATVEGKVVPRSESGSEYGSGSESDEIAEDD
jgi:hypothetical protein